MPVRGRADCLSLLLFEMAPCRKGVEGPRSEPVGWVVLESCHRVSRKMKEYIDAGIEVVSFCSRPYPTVPTLFVGGSICTVSYCERTKWVAIARYQE